MKKLSTTIKFITALACAGFLQGCTTALYKEQKWICTTKARAMFPPNITHEMRSIPVSKSRQVPNPMYQSTYNCSTSYSYGSSSSTCREATSFIPKYISEYYTEYKNIMVPIDWNKDKRESYATQCIKEKCVQLTYNTSCKQ